MLETFKADIEKICLDLSDISICVSALKDNIRSTDNSSGNTTYLIKFTVEEKIVSEILQRGHRSSNIIIYNLEETTPSSSYLTIWSHNIEIHKD